MIIVDELKKILGDSLELRAPEQLFWISNIFRNHFGSYAIFRGHSDATWDLVPSVFRPYIPRGQYNQHKYDEVSITAHFKNLAPSRHNRVPNHDSYDEWLCLMRHHGLPTRLLDWTKSSLIATFFACFDELNEDGAIWCLNPAALNKVNLGSGALATTTHAEVKKLVLAPFGYHPKETIDVVAVAPPEIDLRMLVQHSVFTIHSSDQPLQTHPKYADFIYKIIIPSSCKRNLIGALDCIGITRSNIFPDLQNLAYEISDRAYHSLDADS